MSKYKKGFSTSKIIIAVVAVIIGWGLIYMATKNVSDPNAPVVSTLPSQPQVSNEVSDFVQQVSDQLPQEFIQEEIDAYRSMLVKLGEQLTPNTKADADMVLVFVEQNPSVLYGSGVEVPDEVKTAYANVLAEVESIKQSVGYNIASTTNAVVGQEIVITGVLEVADLSEKGVGTMFKIVQDDSQNTYYFLLNDAEVNRVTNDELIGKTVEITIQVTEQTENGVTYKVLSGPTLVGGS
jgi:hypothetical protein